MAGMPGRRLFIAVPLDAAAVAAVTGIVDTVRAEPLPVGMHDVRWVRMDGLHLTLRFLGPTPDDRIDPAIDAMTQVVAGLGPVAGRLAGAGTFPASGRPRAIWIGITDGAVPLGNMSERLGVALASAGWPVDDRPFRPHLTLARADGLVAGPLVARRLEAAVADRTVPFVLDRLALFESVTGGGPARYVPLAEALMRPEA
ncbi:RNA 2',3'-cyclic phosphodiesterase [soil metagenome]